MKQSAETLVSVTARTYFPTFLVVCDRLTPLLVIFTSTFEDPTVVVPDPSLTRVSSTDKGLGLVYKGPCLVYKGRVLSIRDRVLSMNH